MASKDDYNYNWTKAYCVQTHVNNDVKPGDRIVVDDRNGGSAQEVLSVTVMHNRSGKPYKTLLVKAIEAKPAEKPAEAPATD